MLVVTWLANWEGAVGRLTVTECLTSRPRCSSTWGGGGREGEGREGRAWVQAVESRQGASAAAGLHLRRMHTNP